MYSADIASDDGVVLVTVVFKFKLLSEL